MRLKAALEGNLEEYMEEHYRSGAEAVTNGIRQATDGLKTTMRNQIKAAGLGNRLANTWRGDTYPKSKKSISAAGDEEGFRHSLYLIGTHKHSACIVLFSVLGSEIRP